MTGCKANSMLSQRTFPQGEDGSDAQMEYLRCKKYKIDRMECFMSLASLAERETTLVSISKTQQVEILCGQCLVDNTQLAKLWDKDRKTVPKLLQAMEAVGISSSQKVGDNRIITLHSLSGWYVDGRFVKNGFSLKRNADGSATVSSSNDNGSVGKNGTNGNLSNAIIGGISSQQNYSRQSVGNPSSLQEADAKQNEGEHNTYPQHQFGGQTQQSNGSNANGYKPNEYHNGNQ